MCGDVAELHPNSAVPNSRVSSVSPQEKKGKERQVQQFLYRLWSSEKQPNVQSLVELLTAVRRCVPNRKRAGPLLLHCRYVGSQGHGIMEQLGWKGPKDLPVPPVRLCPHQWPEEFGTCGEYQRIIKVGKNL